MRSAGFVTTRISFGLAFALMACAPGEEPATEQATSTPPVSRGPVPTKIRAECAIEVDPDGATNVFLAYGPLDESNGVRIIDMWRQAASEEVKTAYIRCLNENWNYKQ